ncbi:Glycine dehydrogenase (decarboxylating) [Streptomyces griseoloalbus]
MTAPRTPLSELEQGIPFEQRHIGPDHEARAKMLAQVGYGSLDELTAAAVPDVIKNADALDLPGARSEAEVLAELRGLAGRNQVLGSMIGLGYYGTFTPPVILRNVMENPAWYTAYTPYQPEISQGRLEALLNFQTMVADLTGLPTSGASLLDEGTAAAEAMALSRRMGKHKGPFWSRGALRDRRRHGPRGAGGVARAGPRSRSPVARERVLLARRPTRWWVAFTAPGLGISTVAGPGPSARRRGPRPPPARGRRGAPRPRPRGAPRASWPVCSPYAATTAPTVTSSAPSA